MFISAAVIIAGVIAVRIATSSGMPGLLWFIGIGLIIGESGFGIQFDDPALTFNVANVLLALLLIDGGFTTRWSSVRSVLAPAGLLATVGVLASITVTALATWAILGVDPRIAILLAAMVSSTDAAATFAILRKLPIKNRPRTLLEAESGFNDPLVIIFVTVVASETWNTASPLALAGQAFYQLIIGAIVGLLVGRIGQLMLARVSLPSSGLYPIAVISVALYGFALAGLIGASGLLSAYVIGLWLGNKPLPHRKTTEGFGDAIGHLAQIALFVMLGLLASPSQLPTAILPSIVIGSVLTFIARPFSVSLCLMWFKIGPREQAFISWAGLRGAVPIVLATIPLTQALPGAKQMFHIIFLLVVFFTLLQGPLLPTIARWMKVIDTTPTEAKLESTPLEDLKAALVQFQVPHDSQLIGLRFSELKLPKGAVLATVVRNGEFLDPGSALLFNQDDQLFLAVPAK
ncbi:MAG: potassium/proton antiporter, partial [Propionibacterium sp.]